MRREREKKPSLRISKKESSFQPTHVPVLMWLAKFGSSFHPKLEQQL